MGKSSVGASVIEDGDLDMRSLGTALLRRKRAVLWPTLLVAIAAAIAVNMVAPRYKSEARIVYDGRENVFLRPEAEKPLNQDRGPADPETLTNQIQLVLSRSLALEVIGALKLNESPEFDPLLRSASPVRHVLAMAGLARDLLAMSPEERVLESWYDRLTVYAVDKSSVIVIEFYSLDPALAAQVTNAVAEAYLRLQQAAREEQTRGAGTWLAGEIDGLRRKVVDAEAKAEEFRSRTNLMVGTNNTSLSHQQLGEFNSQLGIARGQKADAETRARIIRDMLRRGEPIDASDVVNSELIRRLSEQRVTLRGQLAEQSSTLLDGHPRIKELKAQIGDLDHQIRAEAEKLVRTLENEARIAGGRVDALSTNLDTLKRQAASTNEEDVQFRALEREAKAQRDLLESYLARYRETTARESIGNAPPDAKIISAAIVSNTPYFPKKVPIVTVATLIAFIMSAGLVTTSELLRASAAAGERSEAGAEEAVIAARVEPRVASAASARSEPVDPPQAGEGREGGAPAMHTPHLSPEEAPGTISEVVMRLRQSVAAGRAVAVFALGDTPTTQLALTLARALAADARVVLVGLVRRSPVLDAVALRPHMPGLSDVVQGRASFGEVVGRDRLSRLHLINFGASDVPLAALFGSRRFAVMMAALARAYDHVVIDAGRLGEDGLQLASVAPRCVAITQDRGEPGELRRLAAAGFADIVTLAGRDAAAGRADRRAA
jgi:succinoglycan biosynthesis transport protein ExoP